MIPASLASILPMLRLAAAKGRSYAIGPDTLTALLDAAERKPSTVCIGRPIIQFLARNGAWTADDGTALVAADDLWQRDPYAPLAPEASE